MLSFCAYVSYSSSENKFKATSYLEKCLRFNNSYVHVHIYTYLYINYFTFFLFAESAFQGAKQINVNEPFSLITGKTVTHFIESNIDIQV